jgi:HlyD family type I secretion membrane fusion protein
MAQLPSLIPQRNKDLLAAPISAFESEVQAVVVRTTPYSHHAFLHVFTAIVVAILVLMSVVKVDEVVESTGGDVASDQGPIFIQPYQEGIVRQIMVKVGDVVKKGQVLATLDPTFATADMTQLQDHLASDEAMVARLEAEQENKPYEPKGDGKFEKLQLKQWQQRQQEYKQSIAGYDAQIANARALMVQAQSDVAHYSTRVRLNGEIAHAQRTLANDGNAAKLVADQAEDTLTEIMRLMSDAKQQIEAQTASIDNVNAQKAVYIETWTDYVANNLVTTRNDLDQTQQSLSKAQKVNDLVTLTSPSDAIVLQINSMSAGSIVQTNQPNATSGQTQPLITLTPLHGPTLAELQIDTEDVAFLRVGDPVVLEIDAYPYIRFGNASGTVRSISEGSFTQQDNGQIRSPFFKVVVEVTKLNLRNVPKNARLIPGMTLTGNINVGRRTLMSYLIEAMMRNANEAMREP